MPSEKIKDITPDNLRGIIINIVQEMVQPKSEAGLLNWLTGCLTVDDKQEVQIDKKKLEQFSNTIVKQMIKKGLINPTTSEIFDIGVDAISLLVHTCFSIVPHLFTGETNGDAFMGLIFPGVAMIAIGATMLANPLHVNISPEMSWGILGAGLGCFGMLFAPSYSGHVNTFIDSLYDLSLKSADDVAMFFINKVQTAAEHSNQPGGLGLVDSLSKGDLESIKDFSKQMLDSLAKVLPDADKEILKKAEQVIKDGSYDNIKSINDLKAGPSQLTKN